MARFCFGAIIECSWPIIYPQSLEKPKGVSMATVHPHCGEEGFTKQDHANVHTDTAPQNFDLEISIP
jgi:hypothetical protein